MIAEPRQHEPHGKADALLRRAGQGAEPSRVAQPGEEHDAERSQERELIRVKERAQGFRVDALCDDDRVRGESQQDEHDKAFSKGQATFLQQQNYDGSEAGRGRQPPGTFSRRNRSGGAGRCGPSAPVRAPLPTRGEVIRKTFSILAQARRPRDSPQLFAPAADNLNGIAGGALGVK